MNTLRASIDLGTHTCLLLIAECDEVGTVLKIVEDHAEIVRLGEGVDSARRLSSAAMERAVVCLKKYAERVRAHSITLESVTAVATSQARDAANREEFFQLVFDKTGLKFCVLSGEQEARASFRGALFPGMEAGKCGVLDLGGGSTEWVTAQSAVSVDMGSVRMTERWLKSDPVTDDEFWACRAQIDELVTQARRKMGDVSQVHWVGVAGTVTTLASMHLEMLVFDRDRLDACVLTRGDVHRLVEELKWRSVAERMLMPGLTAARAKVILAGAMILWRSMEGLGLREISVSTRGLRFGILQKMPID